MLGAQEKGAHRCTPYKWQQGCLSSSSNRIDQTSTNPIRYFSMSILITGPYLVQNFLRCLSAIYIRCTRRAE